jgi:hypothetical protein
MKSSVAFLSIGCVMAALVCCGCQEQTTHELPTGTATPLKTQIQESVQALADSGQLDSSVEWLGEAVEEYKGEDAEKGEALAKALAELQAASGESAVKAKAEAMLKVLE